MNQHPTAPAFTAKLCGFALSTLLFGCRNAPADGVPQIEDAAADAYSDEAGCAEAGSLPSVLCEGRRDAAADNTVRACPTEGLGIAPPPVLAARLSRFLWAQPEPSADVLAKISGATSADAVRAVSRWMVTDERFRNGIRSFVRSWLRLDDLPSIPKPPDVLTAPLIASMQNEAPNFAASVIFDGDAKYATLMTAPYTFVDQTLAGHYGMQGVTGSEFRRVPYDRTERIGILGGAGVLTRYSGTLDPPWPPRRFWLVYETMLCDSAALPPAIPVSMRSDPTITIREDLDKQTSVSPCSACHATVNPIGYTFSRFDGFGRYLRVDERNVDITTNVIVPAGLVVSKEFQATDAGDMIRQLITRPEVRRCFSARLLEYGLNPSARDPASSVDRLSIDLQCSVDEAHNGFEATNNDIRALVVAITGTAAFVKTP